MRIGMAGPSDLSVFNEAGIETPRCEVHHFPYIAQLALEYHSLGHYVHVFTTSFAIQEVIRFSASPRLAFTVIPQRKSNKLRALDQLRDERRALTREMQKVDLDVVHSHWLYEYASAALASGTPTLVTCHDAPLSVLRNYSGYYWWFRELLGLRVLLRAEHLTAVAPSLQKELRITSFWSKLPVVIPNGVKSSDITTPQPTNLNNEIIFASIAKGFNHRKNTANAISAFARLPAEAKSAGRLLLIGSGHEQDGPAHTWACAQNLELQNIQFLGELPHGRVEELLESEVDVLVHTSRWEACSLAILEAGARGVPTIGGTRSGGVSYTIGGPDCGIPVDINSIAEISQAMHRCIADRSYIAEKSKLIRGHTLKNFSLSAVVETYLRHLSKIARK